jgi:hypothetical protein
MHLKLLLATLVPIYVAQCSRDWGECFPQERVQSYYNFPISARHKKHCFILFLKYLSSLYESHCSSPSIIRIIKSRRMRWAEPCSTNGEKRDAYRLLVGKRPLGRSRRRWVDNIRMDLGEVGWGDADWIGLAKDSNRWRTLVNSVLNLRVPWNAGKLSSSLTSSVLSGSAQHPYS